jgi:glycosyltransferase involved in cell wall biosynthesis
MAQRGEVEILVIDDGSEDDTSQIVSDEFPAVRLIRHNVSRGLVVSRNEGAREANGDVLFSIDDDAIFTSDDVVMCIVEQFSEQKVGAVAIPYADVNKDNVERQRAPTSDRAHITDRFIGTAHAIQRDVFLMLGGYREFFFHQGEESDFCIRMLDAGYFVRLGNSDRIDHFESPKRDTKRMDLYGRRNDVLFAVLNVPWPWLPLHLVSVTVKGLLFGFKVGRPLRMLQGLLMGYRDGFRYRSHRRAVSVKTYLTFRRLRKKQAVPLSELETQ